MDGRPDKKRKYVTVSIPTAIADDIDELLRERGYWPSKGAFVREAFIEKIWKEIRKIQELKKPTQASKE